MEKRIVEQMALGDQCMDGQNGGWPAGWGDEKVGGRKGGWLDGWKESGWMYGQMKDREGGMERKENKRIKVKMRKIRGVTSQMDGREREKGVQKMKKEKKDGMIKFRK